MRFRTDCPVHIVMLGCGGTGGHIAPHLYRLLHALFRPSKVILCDGDIVEKKNLVRQNFIASDLGKNKAEVLPNALFRRIRHGNLLFGPLRRE